MSERGIPKTIATWMGSKVTFSFISHDQSRYWVKFHFKTAQGIQNLSNEEAIAILVMTLRFTSAIYMKV